MKPSHKATLLVLILCTCIGVDQLTKKLARNLLPPNQAQAYLGDLFRFQFVENLGAILGVGKTLPPEVRTWILIGFNTLVLLGVLWFTWVTSEMTCLGVIGSALVIGGGLSNILDRLWNLGAVIDFMNLGIGSLRTGIFNVADVFIMAGAGVLLVWVKQERVRERQSGFNVEEQEK
jgi:signal peptidase II